MALVTTEDLIARYELQPHPEGGWFRETYRSEETVIHPRVQQSRSASTGILFLITPSNVSRLHRIASDEMWHFYLGSPMTVVEFSEDGNDFTKTVLGEGGEVQYVVKAGVTFGSYSNGGTGPDAFSLVGCTVAPGFDFADFEMAPRKVLLERFSNASETVKAEIIKLTQGLP